ncbi:unnamed protein product [Caenorhabditis auriculariae]|uniref:N-chimaerin n=1 Tax=Caenorhabditis auriculariae TaxID=2777116 RepID=A0A8S1HRN3_9PELO|nr:unnamed protein product [Caenorhabditis auriculariae]
MHGEESGGMGVWKQNLFLLQERCPRPNPIICSSYVENRPAQYGSEFHGLIEREQAERMLLEAGDGSYLVRESKRSADAYTLSMVFDGKVLNYKLYYDPNEDKYFVGEKRFNSMYELVADGLISFFINLHASDYIMSMADDAIYEESPYSKYTKSSQEVTRRPVARCHNFISYTFKAPHYCDYCTNFLWGLVHQGMRCEDCGFAAHKRCSEKTLNDCRPEAKYIKRMFAVDITTLCMAHQINVPPVVTNCIHEIELRGLTVEGIYRVSGSHDHMERLKAQYDSQQDVDLSQVDDIHTVCGILKLYFRLLPQQLVPFSVYKQMLAAYSSSSALSTHDRLRILRKILQDLPEDNINTLGAILNHLKKVSENSAVNKMTVEKFGDDFFSPTLFLLRNGSSPPTTATSTPPFYDC